MHRGHCLNTYQRLKGWFGGRSRIGGFVVKWSGPFPISPPQEPEVKIPKPLINPNRQLMAIPDHWATPPKLRLFRLAQRNTLPHPTTHRTKPHHTHTNTPLGSQSCENQAYGLFCTCCPNSAPLRRPFVCLSDYEGLIPKDC